MSVRSESGGVNIAAQPANGEIERLHEELEDCRNELRVCRKRLEESEKRVNALPESEVRLRGIVNELRDERVSMVNKLKHGQSKLEVATVNLSEAEARIRELESQVRELSEANRECSSKIQKGKSGGRKSARRLVKRSNGGAV
jgi:chromosome segregation ATPase